LRVQSLGNILCQCNAICPCLAYQLGGSRRKYGRKVFCIMTNCITEFSQFFKIIFQPHGGVIKDSVQQSVKPTHKKLHLGTFMSFSVGRVIAGLSVWTQKLFQKNVNHMRECRPFKGGAKCIEQCIKTNHNAYTHGFGFEAFPVGVAMVDDAVNAVLR